MCKLVGRTGARKGVVGDIDVDGLRSQIRHCLLGTSTACSFAEMVQRENIGGYDALMVNVGVVFLMRVRTLVKIEATGKAYKLSCPERHHLQSQLNVVLRILRADITPAVCTWMFGASKLLLHNSQFVMIGKVCSSISITLLLWSFNWQRILSRMKDLRT